MSVSGPEALQSLDEALRDIRREEDEIAKRLARSGELTARYRETEGELLQQLARVRLDPASQAELSGRLNQAERGAREMLGRHTEQLNAAERELQQLDQSIVSLTAERSKLADEAARAQAELTLLAEKAAAEAARSPEYAQQKALADELGQVAEESLRKTSLAETDREEKGRPYREDPLFMYLWERGYGTMTYKAGNLTSWLDGLVARLVRYPEARVNYAMLNEIPLRLREHAERQQRLAEEADSELLKLEQAALDAVGGKTLRETLEAAESRMAAIDAQIVANEDLRDEKARALQELAQGSDPAFSAAIASLAAELGREDIKTLLAQARATETGQDDTLVKQIDDTRQRAQEEDADSRDQKARLRTLAQRRRELEDIQYEFKKAGFDNPRSSFRENDLVGSLLNDFLRGGISAADYWGQWRQSQNWTGPQRQNRTDGTQGGGSGGFNWPDSSFGGGVVRGGRSSGGFGGSWGRLPGGFGGGLGSLGGSRGGGGFSRPRTGSSGSRKSGGFKTGGGF